MELAVRAPVLAVYVPVVVFHACPGSLLAVANGKTVVKLAENASVYKHKAFFVGLGLVVNCFLAVKAGEKYPQPYVPGAVGNGIPRLQRTAVQGAFGLVDFNGFRNVKSGYLRPVKGDGLNGVGVRFGFRFRFRLRSGGFYGIRPCNRAHCRAVSVRLHAKPVFSALCKSGKSVGHASLGQGLQRLYI